MFRSRFVEPAVSMVHRRHPALYAQVVTLIASVRVLVECSDERFCLSATDAQLRTAPARSSPVTVRTSPGALLRLLDHDTTLLAALGSGELEFVGTLQDLLALESALGVFLNACIRSPEAPALLQGFREYCQETTDDQRNRP
ncbi:MAG: hypothetical protein AAGA48_11425 [Myxococcota bacterium]